MDCGYIPLQKRREWTGRDFYYFKPRFPFPGGKVLAQVMVTIVVEHGVIVGTKEPWLLNNRTTWFKLGLPMACETSGTWAGAGTEKRNKVQ
jgi:hypothetical protein